MKTKFACAYCHKRHEEKDAHVIKEAGGIVVYGNDCMGAMAREIDALRKDEAAVELVKGGHDSLRETLLARRAEGLRSAARPYARKKTIDLNDYLVQGRKA